MASKDAELKKRMMALLEEGDDDEDNDGIEVHVQRGNRTTILRGRKAREYAEANRLLEDDEEDESDEEDDDGKGKRKGKRDDDEQEEDEAPQRGKRRIFSGYGDE